jgi:hypothetical protein
MRTTSQQARAEAIFKQKQAQQLDAPKAMAEYVAKGVALRERTARLRALRLAREAAEKIEGRLGVMPGLEPGIHQERKARARDGLPGRARQ